MHKKQYFLKSPQIILNSNFQRETRHALSSSFNGTHLVPDKLTLCNVSAIN